MISSRLSTSESFSWPTLLQNFALEVCQMAFVVQNTGIVKGLERTWCPRSPAWGAGHVRKVARKPIRVRAGWNMDPQTKKDIDMAAVAPVSPQQIEPSGTGWVTIDRWLMRPSAASNYSTQIKWWHWDIHLCIWIRYLSFVWFHCTLLLCSWSGVVWGQTRHWACPNRINWRSTIARFVFNF